MIDLETFLTTQSVLIDDVCQSKLAPEPPKAGPQASLSRSEARKLALGGHWAQCPSERALYRSVEHHLRDAFPLRPNRSPFTRQQRRHRDQITAVTRDAKRRGLGWLAGQAESGWSHRVGWEEGFHLVLSVTPQGVMTGFGFASASTHGGDRVCGSPNAFLRVATCWFARPGASVAEKECAGEKPRRHFQEASHVDVVTAPHTEQAALAHLRHISETVNDKRVNTVRLVRERPHDLTGVHARLAAKVAVHTFCI